MKWATAASSTILVASSRRFLIEELCILLEYTVLRYAICYFVYFIDIDVHLLCLLPSSLHCVFRYCFSLISVLSLTIFSQRTVKA